MDSLCHSDLALVRPESGPNSSGKHVQTNAAVEVLTKWSGSVFGFGKNKQEAWTGVVVRKGQGTNVDEDGERTIYHTLDVRRDDNGKNKHFVVGHGQVSPQLFNSLSEGDRVSKPAGAKQLYRS